MKLSEVIRAAGDLVPFARPCHGIASYYNGHVKDWGQRTRMAMLSLEDLEADDWAVVAVGDERDLGDYAPDRSDWKPRPYSDQEIKAVQESSKKALRELISSSTDGLLPMVEIHGSERARHIAGQEIGRALRILKGADEVPVVEKPESAISPVRRSDRALRCPRCGTNGLNFCKCGK